MQFDNSSGVINSAEEAIALISEDVQLATHRLEETTLISRVQYPLSSARRIWNVIVSMVVFYNTIAIPLRIGFRTLWDVQPAMIVMYTLDYVGVSDMILLLDVLLSMTTQFMEAGVWITDPKSKAIHYLKTWFFLDFISTLPVDAFVWNSVVVHMFVRAPRMLRLVRIAGETTAQIEMHSYRSHYFLLAKLVGGILVLNHVLASALFFIADLQGFGSTPMVPPVSVEQANFWVQYLYGFFWSTNVVTRPPRPSTVVETAFMLFIAMLATFLVASIIGGVAEVISSLNARQQKFRRKMESIKAFMSSKKVPRDLQTRVIDYFDHVWARQGDDDASILSELPQHLRTEISLFINGEIVNKVPLFAHGSPGFIKCIVSFLQPQIYAPGDWIIRAGEAGNEMYFIAKGQVEILNEDGKYLTTLGSGDFFGEIVLLLDSQRTASARAKTYCDLFVLSKQDLGEVLKSFPEQRPVLQAMAETRIGHDLLRTILPKDKYFMACTSNKFLREIEEAFLHNKFRPGEYIYKYGQETDKHSLFFVCSGSIEVISHDETLTLREGALFGQLDLLHEIAKQDVPDLHGERQCSLRAVSQRTIVLTLSRDDFMEILGNHPGQRHLLVRAVKKHYVPPPTDRPIPMDAIYNKKIKRTHSNFSLNTPTLQGLANKKVSFYLRKSKDESTHSVPPSSSPSIESIPAEGRRSSERMQKLEKINMATSPSRFGAPLSSPMPALVGARSAPNSDVGFLSKLSSLVLTEHEIENLSRPDIAKAVLLVSELQHCLTKALVQTTTNL